MSPSYLQYDNYEKEKEELEKWKPPPKHRIKTMRRVYEVCEWIRNSHRIVLGEEIMKYVQMRYGVSEQVARATLKEVVEVFKKNNLPVYDLRKKE